MVPFSTGSPFRVKETEMSTESSTCEKSSLLEAPLRGMYGQMLSLRSVISMAIASSLSSTSRSTLSKLPQPLAAKLTVLVLGDPAELDATVEDATTPLS
jgi:hypothetical protein